MSDTSSQRQNPLRSSTAHHARISKHHEYVQSWGEADLDGGNIDKTPEEQRTLKQIILSDIQGDVVFLPAASSSGGGVSPDISSLLKSLASIALQNGKVLDSNPLQLFLKTAKRKISAALMKAMAVHMPKVRGALTPADSSLRHHSFSFTPQKKERKKKVVFKFSLSIQNDQKKKRKKDEKVKKHKQRKSKIEKLFLKKMMIEKDKNGIEIEA